MSTQCHCGSRRGFAYPDATANVIKQLFQFSEAYTTYKRCYPTPERFEDPARLNHIGRRVIDEILKLRKLEKLGITVDDDQSRVFLDQFS